MNLLVIMNYMNGGVVIKNFKKNVDGLLIEWIEQIFTFLLTDFVLLFSISRTKRNNITTESYIIIVCRRLQYKEQHS